MNEVLLAKIKLDRTYEAEDKAYLSATLSPGDELSLSAESDLNGISVLKLRSNEGELVGYIPRNDSILALSLMNDMKIIARLDRIATVRNTLEVFVSLYFFPDSIILSKEGDN